MKEANNYFKLSIHVHVVQKVDLASLQNNYTAVSHYSFSWVMLQSFAKFHTKSRVYLNLFCFLFKQVSCNCCNRYKCTVKWCQQNSNACSSANRFQRNMCTLIGLFNLLTGTLLANNSQRILMKNLSHQPIWSTCHQILRTNQHHQDLYCLHRFIFF